MRQRRNVGPLPAILCVAAGMGGEMHLAVPSLGTIAMLDFVSYFIAVPILCANWSRMGKYMRRSIVWAFAWTLASMLANLFNFVEPKYWFKCVSLAASSWAIMATAYVLLRNYSRGYLWYLVGAGIGGWIALYHFRNGALEHFAMKGEGTQYSGLGSLIDKQVYPVVAKGILFGCILPFFLMWKKIPIFAVICATFFAGFWLLFNGGSRSGFGMYCAAASAGFAVAYGSKALRRLVKSPLMMCLLAGIALAALFGSYKYMASSGMMGEAEQNKYENEFEEGEGAVAGRAGLVDAFQGALSSGGIGLGWHLRCHSVLGNSLACEGIVGFLFWIYFYLQVLWWASKRMPYSGKFTAFIVLMILTAAWDVFGSPFGTRHKFFVLMTFIALSRDSKYYGLGSLYDQKLEMVRGV